MRLRRGSVVFILQVAITRSGVNYSEGGEVE